MIGREEFEGLTGVDVRGIRWEFSEGNRSLRLIITKADGEEMRGPAYPTNLVYHALTYAADGRALAVTMTRATPLSQLRILVHPALIDTPLGYRVVEIDRLVDKYTDEPKRALAEGIVNQYQLLYELAAAERLLCLPADSFEGVFKKWESLHSNLQVKAQQWLDGVERQLVRNGARLALAAPEALTDPQRTPFTVKTEFYDQELVRAVAVALSKGTTLEDFRKKLRDGLASQVRERVKALKPFSGILGVEEKQGKDCLQYLIRLESTPPEIQLWSGVRERHYVASLTGLMGMDNTKEQPFEFMDQVAFASLPQFPPNAQDDEVADYTDKTPWEFPILRDYIQTTVESKVKASASDQEILATVRDFTHLQRLFRAALKGRLGEQFPLDRLVDLATEIQPPTGTDFARTMRWNNVGEQAESELDVAKTFSAKVAQLGERIGPPERVAPAAADAWKMLCAYRDSLAARGEKAKAFIARRDELIKNAPKGGLPLAGDWRRRWDELWAEWQATQDAWLAAPDPSHALLAYCLEGGNKTKPLPWADARGKEFKQVALIAISFEEQLRLRHSLGMLADERQFAEEQKFAPGLPKLP